jgi:bifunctional non-homologous end joining protein LigD
MAESSRTPHPGVHAPGAQAPQQGPHASSQASGKRIRRNAVIGDVAITNTDRIIEETSGVTKLELARYQVAVASAFLAFSSSRPLALVRFPEGAAHKVFFQRHAVAGFSDEILRTRVDGDEVLSIVTPRGLIELVQFGVIELHGWGARLPAWDKPDWVVLDLDPDEALPFARVVEGATAVREQLARVGLVSFVATTGGRGLHVVAPLRPHQDWKVIKRFSRAVALSAAHDSPLLLTANVAKIGREGRVFVDYLRNAHGATSILPYSPRARRGVPVAMPVSWDDLKRIDPHDYTVRSVPKLLARRRVDPWAAILDTRQELSVDIVHALSGLEAFG